jgi:DNA-directed RNA polymerase specialized sigma24 family protein
MTRVARPTVRVGFVKSRGWSMSEAIAFEEFIRRIRAGDEEAAAELVRNYEPAIRRAARVRLVDTRLQRLFDSMDISQSVFGSFFVRAALGQYDLEKPEQLMKLLVAMSRKKLVDHVRQQGAARRDFHRDRGSRPIRNLPNVDKTPSQHVAAREMLQEFRKRLSGSEAQLADRRAQGESWEQIAVELGGTPDARRKELTRALNRIAQELGMDGPQHA